MVDHAALLAAARDVDTPALFVDVQQLRSNIRSMQDRADAAGLKLRPHTKTHKCPEIAAMQVAAGAAGITVAKVGEAEVMAAHGIDDILIACPLIAEGALARLKTLVWAGVAVKTVVDSHEGVEAVARIGAKFGRPISVYLEVDTGQQRCGVPPGEHAIPVARAITAARGVELIGLFTHAGHVYGAKTSSEIRDIAGAEFKRLAETAEALGRRGIEALELSVGSTPATATMDAWVGATECRPGTYVFYDRNQVAFGACDEEQVALAVVATVVSRPAAGRAIIDAGSKTLAMDACPLRPGFGAVRGHPAAVISRLYEEHGVVEMPQGLPGLRVGERIEIVPNHVCPVVNLFDRIYAVSDGAIDKELAVAARGKVA